MALTPKLEIRQSQSLLMTPQLRQAINLLQLTNVELNELLEQELTNNPLLEREDEHLNNQPDTALPTIDDYDTVPSSQDEDFQDIPADYDNTCDDDGSDREGYETNNWDSYYPNKSKEASEDFDYFEQKLSGEKSLEQILSEQISLIFTNSKDRLIAHVLCENLDDAGYFRGNPQQIALRLKTTPEKINTVLNLMKSFEPSGIFAKNLAECLQLQLKEKDHLDPAMQKLLDNLDLLALRKDKELKKICQIDDDDLQEMIAEIKSLDPKPAAKFRQEKPSYILPDVFVRRNRDGSYLVELNNASLPRLLINQEYATHLTRQNKETEKFLKKNISHANFLMKALHQRAETILRVATEIVRTQRDFFEYGIDYLKPLNLKDIAEKLEMHESTVSRATTGKYMHTPNGLFEFKYFFSAAASTFNGNEDTSTLSIKYKIKELIEAEDPKHILSDDNLVELLAQKSIKIARRTVAKYRESLNIPTSAERKRLKRR